MKSVTLICSTDKEIINMYDSPNYTAYYKESIRAEMERRGIELNQQPPQLPLYAECWV